MANAILFAGGRLDSVTAFAGTPAEATTGGTFDSSYADAAITHPSGARSKAQMSVLSGGVMANDTVVSGDTLWVRWDHYTANGSTNTSGFVMVIYDASGFPWFAVRGNGTNFQMALYYNSGTGASPTWTQVGSAYTFTATTRYTFVIKLTLGSPHSVEWFVNGTSYTSGTFTQASFTAGTSAVFGAEHNSLTTSLSQILMSRGISLVNSKVKSSRPSGAGTNSAWTGAYTNVNEAVNSDATLDSSGTAGQKQSYAMGDVTVPTGYAIASVWHWMRAKNDGTAPQNIKSLVRSGGTDYASANVAGMGMGFAPVGMIYDTDPGTGSPWTQTNFNAAEFGYQSAT